MDSRLKAGILRVLRKLDVEKAFDHVSWDFLMYMLQRCGFSEKWRRWILFCISTVRFSIMINGSPKDFFGSSRGLHQGDPLSPLLFAIVMEALSHLLDDAVLVGHISGFTVGTRSNTPLMVAHLLFADDTLIFCDASTSQIEYLWEILSSFEPMSGLHIKLAKSELVPIGEVTNMGELVAFLGCRWSSLPMTYLGLPLSAKFKDRAIWNSNLERMEQRLTSWKRLYLSKGGKITLIKSILSSLLTYFQWILLFVLRGFK